MITVGVVQVLCEKVLRLYLPLACASVLGSLVIGSLLTAALFFYWLSVPAYLLPGSLVYAVGCLPVWRITRHEAENELLVYLTGLDAAVAQLGYHRLIIPDAVTAGRLRFRAPAEEVLDTTVQHKLPP